MTTDSGMDVSPSWQELKDERDAYRDQLDRPRIALIAERNVLKAELKGYKQSYENVLAERDALAAHVERLTGTIEFLLDTGEWSSHAAVSQMAKGDISLTPTNSFARLKAEWQAEALEDVADSCHEPAQSARGVHDTGVWLRHMAAEIRRQAEGGKRCANAASSTPRQAAAGLDGLRCSRSAGA